MKTVTISATSGAVLETVSAVYGPDTITVKRLGWRRLKEASKEAAKTSTRESFALVSDVGPDMLKAITDAVKGLQEARHRDEPAAKPDPMSGYDTGVLLTIGVVALDGAAPTSEALDDLETETADAAARAIVQLSRPALFETEEERKNA